jgi:hypothetical protein
MNINQSERFFRSGTHLYTCLFLFLFPLHTVWIWGAQAVIGNEPTQYSILTFYASEIALWLALLFFIFWYIMQAKRAGRFQKASFAWTADRLFAASLLAFLLFSICSSAWALYPDLAIQQAYYFVEGAMLFFLILLGPLRITAALGSFFAGVGVQVAYAIYQFFSQSTLSNVWLGLVGHRVDTPGTSVLQSELVGRVLRSYGTFDHPNIFGGFMVVSIMLFTAFFLKRRSIIFARMSLVALPFLLAALFFSFSRSAWLALAVWFGVMLSTSARKTIGGLASVAFLTAVVLASVYAPHMQTRFGFAAAHEVTSVQERASLTQDALTLISKHPLIGVGAGQFTLAMHSIDPTREYWEYQPVHNVFLLLFAELGFIGVVLTLLVLVFFIYVWVHLWKGEHSLQLLFGFLTTLSVLALFDHYLYTSHIGPLLVALCAALLIRMRGEAVHTLSTS